MAGHGRVAAAELIGMDKVPTIRIEHLSPGQIRAYVLADNKLAQTSKWDKSILAIELQQLTISSEIPDITLTGFEVGEIVTSSPSVPQASAPWNRQTALWITGDREGVHHSST